MFVQAKDVVDNDTLRKLDDHYQAFRERVKRHGEVLAGPGRSTGTTG
jgi:hypothetical protein